MILKVLSIKDTGNLEKERVVLRVMETINIGQFAVACTEFNTEDRTFSPNFVSMVWFPDIIVFKNDFIVIYTKYGIPAESESENGITTHFFYFNKKISLWKSEKNGVALLNITDWRIIDSNEIKKSSSSH